MFAFKGVKFYIYHGGGPTRDSSIGLLMLEPGLRRGGSVAGDGGSYNEEG
jgi:hypothetical protein